ncbi:MAG: T9SS type A sorting domain-containing protein [Bacteroidia bacterium]|nr:T9SS type A sorting domain-containing protein [Bacteroidia bacterium]
MKKILLFTCVTIAFISYAQTSNLSILKDSLPDAGYAVMESFNNKLYTFPYNKSGNIYSIDTNNANLTHVATIPVNTSNGWENLTYHGNFGFLKNKSLVSLSKTSGTVSNLRFVFLSVGLTSADTILKNYLGDITYLDTMAYIIAQNANGAPSLRLFSTDMNHPASLLDTNLQFSGGNSILLYKEAHAQKKLYYVRKSSLTQELELKATNGITKQMIEKSPNGYYFSIIGELNNEMYYTISHRTPPNDTTWLKKCDVNGNTTIVDTFLTNSFCYNRSVIFNNKLIISFAREASPYGSYLLAYDLGTNSKSIIATLPLKPDANNFYQTYVGANYFYFKDAVNNFYYQSNGTLSGTKQYYFSNVSNPSFPYDFGFEGGINYQSIGSKAIICEDYPLVSRGQTIYFGNYNNLQPFQIFANSNYEASHFEKIGNSIFFLVRNPSYTKKSVMKLNGCNIPSQSPFITAIAEESNQAESFSIYPNPASELINVKFDLLNDEKTIIKISNILGETVLSESTTSNNFTLKTNNLKSGVYFVTLTNQGKQSTKKIIIE